MIRLLRSRTLSRYSVSASTICLNNLVLQNITRSLSSRNPASDTDVETVFRIITTSPSALQVRGSLKDTGIRFSNDLVDRVLTKVSVSQGCPLPALEFFNYAARLKSFTPTPFSSDTMLHLLGRSRHFDHVRQLLQKISREFPSLISPRTLQVVLTTIAKACSVRHTLGSFRMFQKIVPVMGTSYFNTLLSTLCREKSVTDAKKVYRLLKCDFRPNVQTFNLLLSGWKKSPAEAEEVFYEMRVMGVNPDIVSYNCLIDAYCKGRQMEKAYKVFDKMRDDDVSPDGMSYTSLIVGLGLVDQPDKAREVLKEMKELGCGQDVGAHNAVIRNFCMAKRLDDACAVMDEMVRKGLSPNAATYDSFLRYYYRTKDLESSRDVYRRMVAAQCWPNTQSCVCLVKLCSKHENAEMALELWRDMVEKGFGPYGLVSDVLLDLLCDMGKLAEAEECFLQLMGMGYKPSSVSFRRVKVLMELASRHDDLQNLSEKMAAFRVAGTSDHEGKLLEFQSIT